MSQRRVCAATLITTAGIHVAAVPEHLDEWPAAGGFFVTLAVIEVVLAVGVLRRADRRLLLAGVLVSAASVVLWALSRTVGLPAGPEAFSPEPALVPDVLSTSLEVAAGVLFTQLLRRTPPHGVLVHVHQ